MEIKIYNQKEISNERNLIDFMLNTIIHNLTYLYGPYMDTQENREIWANNNVYNDENNKFLIAQDKEPLGFIIYNINEDKVLTIKDIEIKKFDGNQNPLLIYSLFKKLCTDEYDNFNCVQGYINKRNEISLRNFMRFASYKIEKERGYYIIIDKETTQNLKDKFSGRR